MAIAGMFVLAPILRQITEWLGDAVNYLVDNGLLPLTSIFIEPAKVLFLNNAINHGVLTPLGIQEAAEEGMSILFLLEANPGPGLGLLMAYVLRARHRQGLGPGCGDHPVLRRHPRDLLPVRADEAQDDPRHHRRRHDRHLPAGAVRLRAPRSCGSRIDHRGVRADPAGRFRHAVGCSAPSWSPSPGAAAQDGARRRRGRPAPGHQAMEDEGQEVGGLQRAGPRRRRHPRGARSTTSSSPATPGWGRPPWAPPSSAARSTRRGTPTSPSSTRRPNLGGDHDLVVTHQDLTDRAAADRVGDPRVGRQLHGQPALTRSSTCCTARTARVATWRRRRSRTRRRADARRGVDRPERPGHDPRRRDHGGRTAAGRRRRGRGVLRRLHARAREVRVHAHGQPARDPARHQRREARDSAYGHLVRALPRRPGLEQPGGPDS